MKMKTTEVLYGFWAGTHTASPEVTKSWLKISGMLETSVPEEQRQILIKALTEHCSAVGCDGFTAGFKTAMELWKEL